MRYSINLPLFAALADVNVVAGLAREAEESGWDGFFVWDHIQAERGMPVADPWVALTAIAERTQHLRFGPMVTPLPRRRPEKLARETATLDRLSHGRLVLGVGIGSERWFKEFSTFGASTDDRHHAAMLDEGLAVLTGLWSGQPFNFEGQHYTVRDAHFVPTPVQQPRIPIWVAGMWPHRAPFRRAARWDGVAPIMDGQNVQPEHVREMMAYVRAERIGDAPFDVVVAGFVGDMDPVAAAEHLRSFEEAGVTWWMEGFWWHDDAEMVRARIRQGPPSRH